MEKKILDNKYEIVVDYNHGIIFEVRDLKKDKKGIQKVYFHWYKEDRKIDFRKLFSEENIKTYRTWSKFQEEFWKNVHTPRGEEIKRMPEFTVKPYGL